MSEKPYIDICNKHILIGALLDWYFELLLIEFLYSRSGLIRKGTRPFFQLCRTGLSCKLATILSQSMPYVTIKNFERSTYLLMSVKEMHLPLDVKVMFTVYEFK